MYGFLAGNGEANVAPRMSNLPAQIPVAMYGAGPPAMTDASW